MMSLAGTEHHAHARMVLGHALETNTPSHAYLFHGPPGTGKRTAARAFAAELLAHGSADPEAVKLRVQHGAHPDLTWVKPTGAHVMRVGDVEEPVVAAAGRTPFESSRRVFVLERADTMNDEVANRLLKTLEEPAAFVHLILLTDALGRVLETVVSRCQLVRFDPLSGDDLARELEASGVDAARARACGRLALGNASRARYLASDEGEALRADVESFVRAMLAGENRAPSATSRGGRCSSAPRSAATPPRSASPARPRSGSSSSRRAASARRSRRSSRRWPSATGAGRGPRFWISASS